MPRIFGSLLLAFLLCVLGAATFWLVRTPEWERRAPVASVLPPELVERSGFPPSEAVTCGACHQEIFQEWAESQHAHANRLVSTKEDGPAFNPGRIYHEGLLTTRVFQRWRNFLVRQTGPGGRTETFQAVSVIGVSPLIQYLTPFPGVRLQVINPAYDPAKGDWFDTFSGEERLAHEWGFWRNRSHNWNSQCAACHMTDFQKNYNITSDSYRSTWKAMGISCSQCHGSMENHLKNPQAPVAKMTDRQIFSNCGSCHSRREDLTGKFHPGEDFDDHYRLILPDLTDTFYPDGQMRDENFNMASFVGSKMGHAGLTCLDCHTPHSAKLKLPVENNALCMSCHTPPGTRGALPILNPVEHSHHAAGSAGNRCVECHMPQTTYMARDPRHDHGFTIPDPKLTIEHRVPNACNRCHTDQSPQWAAEWVEKWYGSVEKRPAQTRARLIARARAGDADVVPELLAAFAVEPIAAWRASLIEALGAFPRHPGVREVVNQALSDASPLVRTVAASSPVADAGRLRKAADDPLRSVRMASSWTLAMLGETLRADQQRSLQETLDQQSDQPSGALRQAEFALARGLPREEILRWLRRGEDWDPSPGLFAHTANIRYRTGDLEGARATFKKALAAEPRNASLHYSLALLEGEMGDLVSARNRFKTVVEISPQLARAWYNLGLAEDQLGDAAAAIHALQESARINALDPTPPYALATIYIRRREWDHARRALEASLKADPSNREAADLLQRIESQGHSR